MQQSTSLRTLHFGTPYCAESLSSGLDGLIDLLLGRVRDGCDGFPSGWIDRLDRLARLARSELVVTGMSDVPIAGGYEGQTDMKTPVGILSSPMTGTLIVV